MGARANGPLERPDETYRVRNLRKVPRKPYPAGTAFIRAFNHTHGYAADEFNPRLAPLNRSTIGGRFDGTNADQHGSTYVAAPHDHPHVAFWEVMQNELQIFPDRGKQYIDHHRLSEYSFAYVHALTDIELVDLRDLRASTFFGTNHEAIRSDNRIQTRDWARYIRDKMPNVHGFIYTSRPIGSGTFGDPIVLFADRFATKALEFAPPAIPMASTPGELLVARALKNTAVRVRP